MRIRFIFFNIMKRKKSYLRLFIKSRVFFRFLLAFVWDLVNGIFNINFIF